MDDKRTQEDGLSEMIDAVRPASDDLAQADSARLAERSRRDAPCVASCSAASDWTWRSATPCRICPCRPAPLSACCRRSSPRPPMVGQPETQNLGTRDPAIDSRRRMQSGSCRQVAARAIEALVPDFKIVDAPAAVDRTSRPDAVNQNAVGDDAANEQQRRRTNAGGRALAAWPRPPSWRQSFGSCFNPRRASLARTRS